MYNCFTHPVTGPFRRTLTHHQDPRPIGRYSWGTLRKHARGGVQNGGWGSRSDRDTMLRFKRGGGVLDQSNIVGASNSNFNSVSKLTIHP